MVYNFSLKFLGETNMTCGTLILERFSSSDKKTRSETVVARAIVFEAASKVTAKLKCLFKWRSTMLTPNTAEKENITCQKRERSVFTRASADAAQLARPPVWDAAVFARKMHAVEHAGLKRD
jgi:hypothetical protein